MLQRHLRRLREGYFEKLQHNKFSWIRPGIHIYTSLSIKVAAAFFVILLDDSLFKWNLLNPRGNSSMVDIARSGALDRPIVRVKTWHQFWGNKCKKWGGGAPISGQVSPYSFTTPKTRVSGGLYLYWMGITNQFLSGVTSLGCKRTPVHCIYHFGLSSSLLNDTLILGSDTPTCSCCCCCCYYLLLLLLQFSSSSSSCSCWFSSCSCCCCCCCCCCGCHYCCFIRSLVCFVVKHPSLFVVNITSHYFLCFRFCWFLSKCVLVNCPGVNNIGIDVEKQHVSGLHGFFYI